MRLIKGSLAGLVLIGILAITPTAAFAHGGGGGGHGFGGVGGGHGSIGGGHAFSGFTGRGFSPGFRAHFLLARSLRHATQNLPDGTLRPPQTP